MSLTHRANGAASGAARGLEEKVRFLQQAFECKTLKETHTAVIFLSEDRAFKLKKPVRLPSLDFRTLKAREHVCREELRVNRQLAGACYIGLIALTRRADGTFALRRDEAGSEAVGGRVIDWIIEMERLPDEQMLDVKLLQNKPVSKREIKDLSTKLIAFYTARQSERHREGVYLAHLLHESRANRRRLKEMRANLTAELCVGLLDDGIEFIMRHEPEIAARDSARLVVEGHGDLRPEHVCLLRPPVVFDRIEFAPEMRLIDIYDEVGYLGFECSMLGTDWIGPMMLGALQDAGFTPPSPRLQATYGICRCLIRARLSIDHLRDPHPRTPEKWPRQAQAYLAKAAALRDVYTAA